MQTRPTQLLTMIALTLFLGAVLLMLLAIFWKVPTPALLSVLASALYHPNHNGCGVTKIQNLNPNLFFYIWGTFAILFTGLLSSFFTKKGPGQQPFLKNSILVAGVVFVSALILQTAGQDQYFQNRQRIFSNKPVADRQKILFGNSFKFARFCQHHLTGQHWGKLITGFDLNETLEPYALAYYLYPTIDLLVDTGHPQDCLVIFNKKNPEKLVPTDFKILAQFDPYCLLAVKKK